MNNKINKILMHVCCAPCATYCVDVLKKNNFEITLLWFNPNIHPFTEYRERLNSFRNYAEKEKIKAIYFDKYDVIGFTRNVVFREKERCLFCYHLRMEKTAVIAGSGEFDAFTTTLLISPYQKHEEIRNIGESLAKQEGIRFYYEDFRKGYRKSIEMAKKMGLYRQKYCGCIYSEEERYLK